MSRLEDNTDKLLKQLKASVEGCMNEVGSIGKADLMANCKVKTGTLRRGHFFKTESNGERHKVIFINNVLYAPYVEFKSFSRGGRPWFRQTLNGNIETFKKITETYIKRGMKL